MLHAEPDRAQASAIPPLLDLRQVSAKDEQHLLQGTASCLCKPNSLQSSSYRGSCRTAYGLVAALCDGKDCFCSRLSSSACWCIIQLVSTFSLFHNTIAAKWNDREETGLCPP